MWKGIIAGGVSIVAYLNKGLFGHSENGATWADGWIEEKLVIEGNKKQVILTVKWQNDGHNWNNNYWLQNYVQWSDPFSPENYISMTCNTEYNRKSESASSIVIRNNYGKESIKVSDMPAGKWDSLGAAPGQELFT